MDNGEKTLRIEIRKLTPDENKLLDIEKMVKNTRRVARGKHRDRLWKPSPTVWKIRRYINIVAWLCKRIRKLEKQLEKKQE